MFRTALRCLIMMRERGEMVFLNIELYYEIQGKLSKSSIVLVRGASTVGTAKVGNVDNCRRLSNISDLTR